MAGLLSVLGLASVVTCGDAFAPTITTVSGDYAATRLLVTDGGTVTDWLAEGAFISLTLAPDGTTSGRIFAPGGGEPAGTDLDANLAGTWTLTVDTVRFSHAADTFLRDMAFLAHPDRLMGDATFGNVRIEVTLSKE